MKIGFDYWQVISHYPEQCDLLARALKTDVVSGGCEIHVISAIGKDRTHEQVVGSIVTTTDWFNKDNIHTVEFDHPRESPELKLQKCLELGVQMFFDDRDDVCRLLNKNGIMAMRVTRKDNSTYDLGSEQK